MPSAGIASLSPLTDLSQRLGHRFGRPALLAEALTHGSTAGDSSYERLEFLGDRVLGLLVAEMLYEHFKDEPEGALSKRFAALVQRDTLADVARAIGLGADLHLSPSEAQAGGRNNAAILSDALEAVIGALYLDGGLDVAKAFVERNWRPLLASSIKPPQDAKTALQEWAQARGLALPHYREVGRSGPAHDPIFSVEVSVVGQAPVTAEGRSKRQAEQAAAQLLLQRLTS